MTHEQRRISRGVDVVFSNTIRTVREKGSTFQLEPEHIQEGWKWEAEMKFPNITRGKLERRLKSEEMKKRIARGEVLIEGPIFDGTIKTWQYNDGFNVHGATARVKEVCGSDGKKRYFWTIKVTPPVDATASMDGGEHVLLKNKLEYEHEAPSKATAIHALQEAVRQFGLVDEGIQLSCNLKFTKKRKSYLFKFRGQEQALQLDADMLYGAEQGDKRQKKKLHVLEIEDSSSLSTHDKLMRIVICASIFGFQIDKAHAAQSTRKFLASMEQI